MRRHSMQCSAAPSLPSESLASSKASPPPLMHRVGDEWHAGRLSIAPEHLVSSILHDILAGAMRSLPNRHGAARVLVATPAGDRHAIGAVLVGAAAAMEGLQALYLGPDLPRARDCRCGRRGRRARRRVEHRLRGGSGARARRSASASGEVASFGAHHRRRRGCMRAPSDVAAMDVSVEPSIPGFVARLREIGSRGDHAPAT